jgi:polar amino acid transport system substrate-binding protein
MDSSLKQDSRRLQTGKPAVPGRAFVRLLWLSLCCAGLLTVMNPALAETLRIGVARNEAVQGVAAELITEIYRRAGLKTQIEALPAARLTELVLNNEVDGEVSRIEIYFERNTSLIKVEPAYYWLVTAAFAKTDRKIVIKSKEDLKGYQIGIIRGVYHAAKATEGLSQVVVVDSVAQLFKMLESGRIDVAIDVSLNGTDMIQQLKLKNVAQVGEIARRDLFNVLIPSKASLVPRISATIKSMKASGDMESLIKRFEQKRLKDGTGLDVPRGR